ncbi:hypothetical protein V9T40_010541 [Parthenolecanium corni]|uniref:Uncharacterized protein n=1 Tax=Parthenolecanium corni TaxID=536013 RepID=A0AAN9T6C0_9HEMI
MRRAFILGTSCSPLAARGDRDYVWGLLLPLTLTRTCDANVAIRSTHTHPSHITGWQLMKAGSGSGSERFASVGSIKAAWPAAVLCPSRRIVESQLVTSHKSQVTTRNSTAERKKEKRRGVSTDGKVKCAEPKLDVTAPSSRDSSDRRENVGSFEERRFAEFKDSRIENETKLSIVQKIIVPVKTDSFDDKFVNIYNRLVYKRRVASRRAVQILDSFYSCTCEEN